MLKEFFNREPTTNVDALIDAVVEKMHKVGPLDEEYDKLLGELERLNKIKTENRQEPVSRDTLAAVVGNLAGILIIVAYEQKHVLTPNALKLLIRPRTEG